jgi:pyruvate ferredoxin oxidoreductase alpha subunit
MGTIKDVIDDLREQGQKIGAVSIGSFRPFPKAALQEALKGARRVIVVEKSLAAGQGGVLADHVRLSVGPEQQVTSLIAGLGGRPIFKKSLAHFITNVEHKPEADVHFLDLRNDVVQKEEERTSPNATFRAA